MIKRVDQRFIFKPNAFRRAHASTIWAVGESLVCAWFCGYREGHKTVNIWMSTYTDGQWAMPKCVAVDGEAACWNPVLFQRPNGLLRLFYKVGESPADWKAMVTTSQDAGRTWGRAAPLQGNAIGPDRNKPLLLSDGTLLCGSSTEGPGIRSKFPTTNWRIHFETLSADSKTWTRMDDVDTHGLDLLQPTLLPGENKKEVHALCRSRHGYIFALKSTDEGKTWSEPQQTALKNPNSACEAIVLANGQSLLAFNNSSDRRYPLNVTIADSPPDFGEVIQIEDELGSYEYPSVCQSPDGLVHVTYTWNKRQIAHTTLEVS